MTDQLKKRRSGHRARCTTLISEVDSLLAATPLDVTNIQCVIVEIKRQLQHILKYDDEIQDALNNDADLNADISQASDIQGQANKCIMSAENAIQQLQQSIQASGTQPSVPSQSNVKLVKLPPLELPFFSGDHLLWSNFWDIFESSVHKRTDLDPVHKFNYLRGQLRGVAFEFIKEFFPTNANYLEAVALLKDKFGKEHKLVSAHLNALFNLQSPAATVSSLNQFRAKYEGHLRSLKVLNTSVDQAGFVFAELLLGKLPNQTRDNLNRSSRQNHWNLDDFRNALDKEIEMLEVLQPCEPRNKSQNNSTKNSNNF